MINLYKVKLKTLWVGPEINYRQGDTLTLEDSLGKQLIESGSADLIEIIQEKAIESAIIQAPENAMMPKATVRKPAGKR